MLLGNKRKDLIVNEALKLNNKKQKTFVDLTLTEDEEFIVNNFSDEKTNQKIKNNFNVNSNKKDDYYDLSRKRNNNINTNHKNDYFDINNFKSNLNNNIDSKSFGTSNNFCNNNNNNKIVVNQNIISSIKTVNNFNINGGLNETKLPLNLKDNNLTIFSNNRNDQNSHFNNKQDYLNLTKATFDNIIKVNQYHPNKLNSNQIIVDNKSNLLGNYFDI